MDNESSRFTPEASKLKECPEQPLELLPLGDGEEMMQLPSLRDEEPASMTFGSRARDSGSERCSGEISLAASPKRKTGPGYRASGFMICQKQMQGYIQSWQLRPNNRVLLLTKLSNLFPWHEPVGNITF
jgi:hypothetical protein